MSNELYDDNESIVNGHHQDKRIEEMLGNFNYANSTVSKSKSIGTQKKCEDRNRRQQLTQKIEIQKKITKRLVGLTLAAGLILGGVTGYKFKESQVQNQQIEYLNQYAISALNTLELGTYNGQSDFSVKDNSIANYRNLSVNANRNDRMSHVIIYIYRNVLPSQEFNDFIKSVTYNDGSNYYTDFSQFLTINGYYENSENHSPSVSAFEKYMKNFINENYEEIVKQADNYFTFDGTDNKGQGR